MFTPSLVFAYWMRGSIAALILRYAVAQRVAFAPRSAAITIRPRRHDRYGLRAVTIHAAEFM